MKNILVVCLAVTMGGAVAAEPSVEPFRDGERVLFLGDSITHHARYVVDLQLYWNLRHPGSRVTLLDAGVSGDVSGGGVRRLAWDVLAQKPDRVFVLFGMNDVSHKGGRWLHAQADARECAKREQTVSGYVTNMTRLVRALKENGIRVVLMTPTPYDEYLTVAEGQKRPLNEPFVNSIGLARLAEAVRQLARDEETELVEFYLPMTDLLVKRLRTPLMPDRVHPDKAGHLVMAALILEAMGETGPGPVTLDATGDRREFAYRPKAWPYPTSTDLTRASELVAAVGMANREIVRITGLPTGRWRLKTGGRVLGVYSEKALSNGVDIASLDTPGQRFTQTLVPLQKNLLKAIGDCRTIAARRLMIEEKGGNLDDEDGARRICETFLAKLEKDKAPTLTYYRNCITSFWKLYPNRSALQAAEETARAALAAAVKEPQPWTLSVEPVPEISATPPPAPDPESWTFREDLAKPVTYHAREAYRVIDEYGMSGALETVRDDLDRFMRSAGRPAAKALTLAKGTVEGPESYRLEIASDGSVRLTAQDDDGLRRGVYHFEDRVTAGDLRPVTRKPWLRHRISRCYFAPIKRPPFNRDELMDDTDYYPDEYLNRLAHEGVNGLWLTVEFRNLVETSFTPRSPDAPRRLAKLRRTVEKCARYGIRTWIFCIEPRFVPEDDPLVKAKPDMFASFAEFKGYRVLCPSSPDGRRYLEEAVADLFRQISGLPGILNISHGERPTTCLSAISPIDGVYAECPRCRSLAPCEIHRLTAQSFLAGMRAINPKAEFLSWFYQPHVVHERAPWVADVPKRLPEGATMLYNFESGAVKEQLGRYRTGGDYWLSYAGPSPAFRRVAEAARAAGAPFGAKIQVGCSHECATVPFVPVPGLLYRKYRAMREAGCSTVMQCWYFGNYPGVMNKAAGELAFFDFDADEDEFLRRLAAPDWGEDAGEVATLWRELSDAYEEYPLSNDMQYYGPFHAGVAWPLEAGVEMKPLARTWKPHDPPSGDAIGECLENHTLEEAVLLAARMRATAVRLRPSLERLAKCHGGDPERVRDVGVMTTLGLLFESGADIFDFYLHRFRAIRASRVLRDPVVARREVELMRRLVNDEKRVTSALLPLAKADSRLGFHSEAESHQFHPAKLAWRLADLDRTLEDLDRIDRALGTGETYPLSAHEQSAPAMRCGVWTDVKRVCRLVTRMDSQLDPHPEAVWEPSEQIRRFRPSFLPSGDFVLEGELPDGRDLELLTMDPCGTSWARSLTLSPDGQVRKPTFNVVTPSHEVRTFTVRQKGAGWTFRLVLDASGWNGDRARQPGWLLLRSGETPIWPEVSPASEWRLNIGSVTPLCFGRIGEFDKLYGKDSCSKGTEQERDK